MLAMWAGSCRNSRFNARLTYSPSLSESMCGGKVLLSYFQSCSPAETTSILRISAVALCVVDLKLRMSRYSIFSVSPGRMVQVNFSGLPSSTTSPLFCKRAVRPSLTCC